MVQNKGLIFRALPTGWPEEGKDLTIEDRPIDLDSTEAPEGGLLVKNNYASFDPYQRGRMRDASIKSYSPAYELGKPITNRSISTVLKSKNSKFKAGDVVTGRLGLPIEEYSLVEQQLADSMFVLENPHHLDPKVFVGALGMPGLTAYSSLYEIGKPKKGETIFISAASGAVGQLVGQLAKHEGLHVIGSVGDDQKLEFILKELGFDGGFNYKKEKPADALKRLAPNGIDIYYENVGGEQLEAALDSIKTFGRIVACGMVSQYNLTPKERYGVPNLMNIIAKRLIFQGFIVSDPNMSRYSDEHQQNVQKWIADGAFKAKMSVTHGIDNAVQGFLGMLSGKNFGKAVLEIAPLD